MAQGVIFPEWLNSNSGRNYPFLENSRRTDLSGVFTIPNSLIVAAQINIPRSFLGWDFFVSQVSVTMDVVSVDLGAYNTDTVKRVATVSCRKSAGKNVAIPFVGEGDAYSIVGSITFGDLEETIRTAIGAFSFHQDQATFETGVVFTSVPSMEALEVVSSSGQTAAKLQGIVKLKGGNNIKLSYEPRGDDPYGIIRIDAISGENLERPEDCENATGGRPPCIRLINGVSANENGEFWIEESECIEISPDSGKNSIRVIDLCSQTCCGCEQLEILTTALEQLRAQEEALRLLVNSTQSQQSSMISGLIASI